MYQQLLKYRQIMTKPLSRYIAIHQPLKYHQIMARDRMVHLVTICWISIVGATVLKDVIMWRFDGGPRFVDAVEHLIWPQFTQHSLDPKVSEIL